jgi:hypothetical protein
MGRSNQVDQRKVLRICRAAWLIFVALLCLPVVVSSSISARASHSNDCRSDEFPAEAHQSIATMPVFRAVLRRTFEVLHEEMQPLGIGHVTVSPDADAVSFQFDHTDCSISLPMKSAGVSPYADIMQPRVIGLAIAHEYGHALQCYFASSLCNPIDEEQKQFQEAHADIVAGYLYRRRIAQLIPYETQTLESHGRSCGDSFDLQNGDWLELLDPIVFKPYKPINFLYQAEHDLPFTCQIETLNYLDDGANLIVAGSYFSDFTSPGSGDATYGSLSDRLTRLKLGWKFGERKLTLEELNEQATKGVISNKYSKIPSCKPLFNSFSGQYPISPDDEEFPTFHGLSEGSCTKIAASLVDPEGGYCSGEAGNLCVRDQRDALVTRKGNFAFSEAMVFMDQQLARDLYCLEGNRENITAELDDPTQFGKRIRLTGKGALNLIFGLCASGDQIKEYWEISRTHP